MFLDGDRNITAESAPENGILKLVPGGAAGWTTAIHNNSGNSASSDGSVQQCSNSGLQEFLKNSGDADQHLAISPCRNDGVNWFAILLLL